MSQHLSGLLVSCGVDWITATARDESREIIRDVALGLADVQLHGEMFGRPWSTGGYEGFAVGHVQYGERPDGCVIRLGGPAAHAHWQRVADAAHNITRLDLQATFRTNREPGHVIHGHYKQLLTHNRKMKRGPSVSMLVKDDGSRTVYSGRRASNKFGRIYDKGKESGLKQFEGCVRYEMETKGKAALLHARAIRLARSPDPSAGAMACKFFSNRGGIFGTLTKSFSGLTSKDVIQCPVGLTDVERQFEWLRKSVASTLQRVITARGRDHVLNALGCFRFPDVSEGEHGDGP